MNASEQTPSSHRQILTLCKVPSVDFTGKSVPPKIQQRIRVSGVISSRICVLVLS